MEGIGIRLKAERKKLGLSQHELGAIGGIEANAQGLYERGKRFPNAGYLGAIAEAGVDVLFVITGAHKVLALDAITAGDTKLLRELDGLPEEVQEDIKRLITTLFTADAQS
ncbi:MAG TPA: helix-turn-helix transcriptional regulator [Pseudomonas sp.]|jgi:transcriptional regulator with XRE-family HTH domain